MSYDGPSASFVPDDDALYGPVADWETDFDHADPGYNPNTWQIWSELREGCPVAHSDRYGGAWLPVTHADVQAIAPATVSTGCTVVVPVIAMVAEVSA